MIGDVLGSLGDRQAARSKDTTGQAAAPWPPVAGRQRDLFPMPLVGGGSEYGMPTLSRRPHRRRAVRLHHLHRLNAAISSLNSLYGCPSVVGDPVNESQRTAIQNMNTALHRLGRQPEQYAETRE